MASGRGFNGIVPAQLGALNFSVRAVADSMSSTQAVRTYYRQVPYSNNNWNRVNKSILGGFGIGSDRINEFDVYSQLYRIQVW